MEQFGIVVLKPSEANANDRHVVVVYVVTCEGFTENFCAGVNGPGRGGISGVTEFPFP